MNQYYPFVNTPLPYDYSALEPYIDTKTMQLHHDRHLATYIDNLNNILKDYPRLQKLSLTQLIYSAGNLPAPLATQIRNNAGGVYNHRFFFDGMKTPPNGAPVGQLAGMLEARFSSFENFKDKFRQAALSVFGSGYAWLTLGRAGLAIITTANQNNPIERGLCPIIALDVWEHAYYLKHYNKRVDYINDWFNLINWEVAERNYRDCVQGILT